MSKIEVELQDYMGSDRAIANAAWTSTYNKAKREERSQDEVNTLVARLIADGHSTPVESVVLRFWIRMPVFTDRQHMTHRIASHNGLSGRYRTMPEDFIDIPEDVLGIVEKAAGDWGVQAFKNDYDLACTTMNKHYRSVIETLKGFETKGAITNTEMKRVREFIRGVLPTAGMVERTTIMNLRSFANYQKLRNSDHAQPEIRFVAQEMLRLVKDEKICPVAIEALEKKGWVL